MEVIDLVYGLRGTVNWVMNP